ncbi:MAG TPA: UDP-glucuronic acid decarboxylase family protein [Acidobacteriota bacterium]|nr:UDP-glucuronic acid decarboxylase family protein [Acidobacteriota bacterium]
MQPSPFRPRHKRVLVTGGAGFIGSHLCRALLQQGHDVLCLDNLYCSRKRNVFDLLSNSRFEFLRHDITQPILLEVDLIYNLACPASPLHYQHNPVKTVKTNVMGVIHMLGLAKRVGARILQASTSEVYGDPKEHPQAETYWGHVNPVGRRSCYDEGKRLAETLMMDYHRQNSVDIRIARIFNTYGPFMHEQDGRVVSNFVVQALKGEPLEIYGDGSQTRSFCYVSDLVEGLIALMESQDLHQPVNLGNPDEFTILELAQLVLELTGSASQIEYAQLPQDDPVRRRPAIDRARQELGWQPKVPLRQGLQLTIDYFDDLMRHGQ